MLGNMHYLKHIQNHKMQLLKMTLINVIVTGQFLITDTKMQQIWVWSLMDLYLYPSSAEYKLGDLEQDKLRSYSGIQCFH